MTANKKKLHFIHHQHISVHDIKNYISIIHDLKIHYYFGTCKKKMKLSSDIKNNASYKKKQRRPPSKKRKEEKT
jgi:hypothetical protein